jgi:hypothetical protein
MAEFYVEKAAQSNGGHIVHKSNCSVLPSQDAVIYLGAISNSGSALKKAGQTFKQIDSCSHCLA